MGADSSNTPQGPFPPDLVLAVVQDLQAAVVVTSARPAVKAGNPTRKTDGGVIKRDPITGLFPQLTDLISKLGKAMEQAK